MSDLPPLRADAERNRQRLLDAAREVFAERGLDVTLDDVAKHAGVGVGTAYRRFRNKDELIDELLAERVRALAGVARACLEEADPAEGIRRYISTAMEIHTADRSLNQVLYAPGRGGERVADARKELVPTVAKLVKRAVQAGAVRPDLSVTDMPIIVKMLSWVVDFSRDTDPELWRRYLDIVLAGLRPDAPPERLSVGALSVARFQRTMASYRP